MVTIQIGGNDIGFSSVAEDCTSTSPEGTPCQDRYVHDGRDEISERIQAAAPLVAAVLQGIHAGYWQCQHPHEEGFRPDQVMRYSEANLNRVQIAGELHVKSGKVLGRAQVSDFEAPLDVSMLHSEASWEQRSRMFPSQSSSLQMARPAAEYSC